MLGIQWAYWLDAWIVVPSLKQVLVGLDHCKVGSFGLVSHFLLLNLRRDALKTIHRFVQNLSLCGVINSLGVASLTKAWSECTDLKCEVDKVDLAVITVTMKVSANLLVASLPSLATCWPWRSAYSQRSPAENTYFSTSFFAHQSTTLSVFFPFLPFFPQSRQTAKKCRWTRIQPNVEELQAYEWSHLCQNVIHSVLARKANWLPLP